MEKLAWPVVHGSLSTILGVTVLAFIDSYMVLVFFKTLFLVLVIGQSPFPPNISQFVGVFHALILLPIVLELTTPLVEKMNRKLQNAAHQRQVKKSVYAITLPVNVHL